MDKNELLISLILAPRNLLNRVVIEFQCYTGDQQSEHQIEIVSTSKIYYCEACQLNFRLQRELDEHLNSNECLRQNHK